MIYGKGIILFPLYSVRFVNKEREILLTMKKIMKAFKYLDLVSQ